MDHSELKPPLEWLPLKALRTPSVDKDLERRELSYNAGGCAKWSVSLETNFTISLKLYAYLNQQSHPSYFPLESINQKRKND